MGDNRPGYQLMAFGIGMDAVRAIRDLEKTAVVALMPSGNDAHTAAELKQDGYKSIPISRKYQDAITKLL